MHEHYHNDVKQKLENVKNLGGSTTHYTQNHDEPSSEYTKGG